MVTICPPEPYAVYVLECEAPETVSQVERECEARLGYTPDTYVAAFHSRRILYVGATGSIVDRLKQHTRQLSGGATFTHVFKPVSLSDVYWHSSSSEAFTHEERVAVELQRGSDDLFVYQN
jgi:predicted GIY-YIG superfamily endonuclease